MKEWIRSWRKIDINEVSSSLLVVGILSAECFSCRKIGLAKEVSKCPECGVEFGYVGFRNKATRRDLEGFNPDRRLILIDFEDFMTEFNRIKAKKLLDSH